MKLVLIGYGKMGKAIEKIALERGHDIVAIIDKGSQFNEAKLCNADVAIEFTNPDSVIENIQLCFENEIPVVVGTTGWYNQIENVKQSCKKLKGGLFTATNFSVGVHLFFKINETMAKLMNNQLDYTLSIEEIHHKHKLDAPSGTAITTAERILSYFNRKTTWVCSENNIKNTPLLENELEIISKRIDNVPGTHTVKYTSLVDDIEITHTAHNREGFALGAVLAAEFMKDKSGVFGMNDLLKL